MSESEEILEGLDRAAIEEKLVGWNESFDTYFGRRRTDLENDYRLFRQFFRMIGTGKQSKTTEGFNRIFTALPFINSAITGKSQIVEGKADFSDPGGEVSAKVTKVINHLLLTDSSRGYLKLVAAMQNMLWCGSGIAKWYFDDTEKPEYSYDSPLGYIETKKNLPNFKTINIFDYAFDPNTTSQDYHEIEWVRDRVRATKGELNILREKGVCEFDDADLISGDEGKYKSSKAIRDRMDNLNFANKKHYYDEFYFDHIYKDTIDGTYKKARLYAWLLNNKKLIKLDINKWGTKPYVMARCNNFDKEHLGLGMIDVISAFVEQLDQIQRHSGTLVDKSGKRMVMHTPAAGLNALAIRDLENGMIMMKNIGNDAIRTEPTEVDKALNSLIQYSNNYITPKLDAATGLTQGMQGFSVGDTATESTILNNNAFARLSTVINDFLHSFIVELANGYFILLKNASVEGISIFVDGENITLSAQDFQAPMTFKAVGSVDQANRNLRAAQMTQYLDLWQKVAQLAPQLQQGGGDIWSWFQNEVNPLFGIGRSYISQADLGGSNPAVAPNVPPVNQPGISPSPASATPAAGPTEQALIQQDAATVADANNPMTT